jgi:hypothetical protein
MIVKDLIKDFKVGVIVVSERGSRLLVIWDRIFGETCSSDRMHF